MAAKQETGSTSLLLPAVLGVLGLACLAGALLLAPLIVRQGAHAATCPNPAPSASCPEPDCPICGDGATADNAVPTADAGPAERSGDTVSEVAQTEPPAESVAGREIVAEPPVAGASAGGPWNVTVDPRGYAVDEAGRATAAAVAAYLGEHPEARAVVTGVNSPKKSSKRAKAAARAVRDLVVELGASPRAMSTQVEQEAGFEGLEARIAVAGGAR